MADQIARTMLTLAENNKDVKMSLRLLLKYEIQALLDRLSQLGEDSLLILSNSREETCSQFGTSKGEKFLQAFSEQQNMNLMEEFSKFCCNYGNHVTGNWNQSMPSGNVDQPVKNLLTCTPEIPFYLNQMPNNSRPQGPQRLPCVIYKPYDNPQGNKGSDSVTSSMPEHVRDRKKRNACRHFSMKGYCWQGSNCAFLHTRDPGIIGEVKNLQHTTGPDTGTQQPMTSSDQIDKTVETSSSMLTDSSQNP